MISAYENIGNGSLIGLLQKFILNFLSHWTEGIQLHSHIVNPFLTEGRLQLNTEWTSGLGENHDVILLDPFGYRGSGVFLRFDNRSHGGSAIATTNGDRCGKGLPENQERTLLFDRSEKQWRRCRRRKGP